MNGINFVTSLVRKGPDLRRRLRIHLLAATLILGGLLLAPPATLRADSFSYTGSALGTDPGYAFDNSFTNVSGTFTTSASVGDNLDLVNITSIVSGFSFSDGVGTITLAPTNLASNFIVSTNSSGAITSWSVYIEDASGNAILSCGDPGQAPLANCEPGTGFGGTGDEVAYDGYVGLVVPGAGAWVRTPEPTSLSLLGAGLACLLGIGLRRKVETVS
jgi:hypothetical protein